MVETYFERTPRDEEFYKLYIKDRLPKTVIDAHMHLIPTQFRGEIAECERKAGWALQCVSNMSYDDYLYYAKKFYPDSDVNINAFPSLSRTVDQVGSNGYIGERHKAGKIQFAHLAVRPWYTMEYITEEMNKYNFNGLKPYPDAGPGTKGGEVPIFQFLPHEQCQWLNEKKKSVVLHLPRAKRLVDDDNVRELKEMREKYPDIKILESQTSNWSQEKGLKLMENFLQKYPKIDGLWTGDDDVLLGALKAYEESGRSDIRCCIGGAGAKTIVKRVLEGDPLVSFDVTYPPRMIEIGARHAADILTGAPRPAEKRLVIEAEIISAANAKDFYFPDSIF